MSFETTESAILQIRLTDEQEAIAAAPPEARMLVTAGAGTGKTYVLIERLHRLDEAHGLNVADDVLVVSFSRAAVGEIRRRMREREGAAVYGTVSTFDSYASQLLNRHAPQKDLGQMDFDARIGAARQLIESSDTARQELERLRHVIVDEVQDLVGVRRELVQTILQYTTGGFTLFGDPAQGIYNFQADDRLERQLGSLVFFDWVRNKLDGPPIEQPPLRANFRYQTDEARSAAWAGPLLNADDPDYEAILEKLEDGLYDLEPVGAIEQVVAELRARSRRDTNDGSIGILCHFNFEVLRVSERLAAASVDHHYQRPASDRSVPGWVARTLRSCDSSHLGRTAFETIAADLDGIPSNAWPLLKRFDPRGSRDMLDLLKVQERIRVGDIPSELTESAAAKIVVSTIHRAKGLEFDRVLLFEPGGSNAVEEEYEIGEAARQLYVARTRARRRYGVITRGRREYARKQGNPGEVWTVHGFSGRRRYVKEIEIKGSHSWAQDPAGGFAFSADAEATQQYIERDVCLFDRLRLRRTLVQTHDVPRYFYVIEHNSRDVGVADIGWILKAVCRPKYEHNWPSAIDGLFVESVDTVAGTSAAGTRMGLTSSGIWLRVRPYGLGRLHWSSDD